MKKPIICILAGVFLTAAQVQATPDIDGLAYCIAGGNLSNTVDYAWWYGCSPTSAGMMVGHYDRNGYNSLYYPNLVPGGAAEASTYGMAPWTALVDPVIASPGHVTDFYGGGGGAFGDDVSPPHHSFNSLADFMGTSQDSVGNPNGWTNFWYWVNGSPFTDAHAVGTGVWPSSGMYGIGEYVGYAGYGTSVLYNQLLPGVADDLWGVSPNTLGFTLAQYQAEIDSGRPIMIHVEGHSMYGYGYVDGTNLINVYDTWGPGPHTMAWGGSYPYGSTFLDHYGVTVMELTGGVIPAPGAILLASIGVGLVGWLRRRRTL